MKKAIKTFVCFSALLFVSQTAFAVTQYEANQAKTVAANYYTSADIAGQKTDMDAMYSTMSIIVYNIGLGNYNGIVPYATQVSFCNYFSTFQGMNTTFNGNFNSGSWFWTNGCAALTKAETQPADGGDYQVYPAYANDLLDAYNKFRACYMVTGMSGSGCWWTCNGTYPNAVAVYGSAMGLASW